jgi:hypothetical protein
MAQRPKTICRQVGCGQYVDGDYCVAHKDANAKTVYDKARSTDETRRMYQSARWRKFRAWILNRSPMCARLVRGEACRYPATIIHHLIDPAFRPDLFVTASNVCPTCALHHPAGVKGTPEWKPYVDYTPVDATIRKF